jgi:protein-S-isoprenylcysteine O-methyltransferase Ste14
LVNLVMVLSVPWILLKAGAVILPGMRAAALRPDLATVVFLCACSLMCAADLARTLRGEPAERLAGFQSYQRLSFATGVLLLVAEWCALLEYSIATEPVRVYVLTGAAALAAVGCAIRLLAIMQLGAGFVSQADCCAADGKIATGGIYSFVRHPSELGLLVAIVGLLVCVQAWWTASVVLPLSLVLCCQRIRQEESSLLASDGALYKVYCAQVGCLVPRAKALLLLTGPFTELPLIRLR